MRLSRESLVVGECGRSRHIRWSLPTWSHRGTRQTTANVATGIEKLLRRRRWLRRRLEGKMCPHSCFCVFGL